MSKTSNGELDMNGAVDLDKLAADMKLESYAPKVKIVRQHLPTGPNLPSVRYSTEESVNNEIGKLTAEAVLRDYEVTAEAIKVMASELTRTVIRCEEYMTVLHSMIKDVNAVADSYRTKGADIFKQIEQSAQMTESIRQTAADMASKISTKLEI